MDKVFRIPSKLYFDLWSIGNSTPNISGDKLISIYSTLKTSRGGEVKYYAYKAKNNKEVSGYALLRNKTGVSLCTLKKYVPTLMEMDLCYFDNNGDFVLIGNDKLKRRFNNKLIPIKIGKNFLDTSDNVMSVRLFSAEKSQKNVIKSKQTRSELYKRADNPRNLKEYKKIKRLIRKGYTGESIDEKIVMSIERFAVLKDGTYSNKSKGCYWKAKLKKKGIVKTHRNFNKIEKMSYEQYLCLKSNTELSYKTTYKDGWMVAESISSFFPVDILGKKVETPKKVVREYIQTEETVKEAYKKKPYLQFDMIDFWINS